MHQMPLRTTFWLSLLWLPSTALGDQDSSQASAELLRDPWGIPHVFAETDEAAMYGLGYATAHDRGFQMYYTLRIMQGRVAELIGETTTVRRGETAADTDRKMRSFGFYPAAKRVAEGLDAETRELLFSYCDGVNAYFSSHREDRHYLFGKLGLEPEPWTPADCLVSWWRIAKFFGTDGTRDLIASRGGAARAGSRRGTKGRALTRAATQPRGEEAAAVVGREDVTQGWLETLDQFCREHGIPENGKEGTTEGPKFSHAWVVGGSKTSTGSAVLVSDPQTTVANPSMFYEFHIRGETFNARGIGVPGSPIILIGFSDKVAWGMTALGADQADLFRLKTDAQHPDQYFFEGEWLDMEVTTETIRVKGGRSQQVTLRRTRFGPVITDHVFARPGEGQFAVKRIPTCEIDRDTVQGAIAMMRADDVHEFGEALAGWRFPSANVVFGDTQGNVGYWVLGALPVRSRHAPEAGRFPHDGSDSKYDWQGMIPHDLKPHVINPKRGYAFSGNHRPVGSFYRPYIGNSTGAMGDTLRSWRLRELISTKERFAPEDVLAIHYDMVNPARRDIIRMGYHLRDVLDSELSRETRQALGYLESWYQAGCPSDLTVAGAELAGEINTMFRMMSTELALEHGGGETGLSLFSKSVQKRLSENPQASLKPLEREYVDDILRRAWNSARGKYGPDPSEWQGRAQRAVYERAIGYYQSLDGFPSLDPEQDLNTPGLVCVDGATIRSQGSQAYTQFVPLHDVDKALSILPIGTAERPGATSRTATLEIWGQGELHPAPLSRHALEALAQSRQLLSYPP